MPEAVVSQGKQEAVDEDPGFADDGDDNGALEGIEILPCQRRAQPSTAVSRIHGSSKREVPEPNEMDQDISESQHIVREGRSNIQWDEVIAISAMFAAFFSVFVAKSGCILSAVHSLQPSGLSILSNVDRPARSARDCKVMRLLACTQLDWSCQYSVTLDFLEDLFAHALEGSQHLLENIAWSPLSFQNS